MENQFTTSLWGDEGFSAILSMKSLPEIIKIIAKDTSPPLWNIWEWLFFRLFGTEEIVIRGLAFIFFLGTVFFTYKIGNFLWNRKTGILAAVLTFLNPFFFTYAFEGRMYSILALGVTASMYFFIKILRSENKVKKSDKVGYVIATLWAMYSHHFAIFAIFLQGLWFIWEFLSPFAKYLERKLVEKSEDTFASEGFRSRRSEGRRYPGRKPEGASFAKRKIAKKIFWLFVFVGIGYLPWILPLYNQTKMVGGGFWLGTPGFTELVALISSYLAMGITTYEIPLINLKLYSMALLLVLAALIIRRWSKDFKVTLFLVSWFLFPILVTWIVSQFFQSIFFNRYLLYTIPAAMILLASNGRKYSRILIGIILIVFAIIDFQYFTHPTKRPFRELSAYVKETRQEGDFLINWYSNGTHHIWETKYYDIPAPIYIQGGGDLPFFVGTALMEEGDVISELPEGIDRVGVVTSGPIEEINLQGFSEEDIKIFKSKSPGGSDIKFIWYNK